MSYFEEQSVKKLLDRLDAINDSLICIQNNLCASDIMHEYKQSFDDIQTLLTTVDRDQLHELAQELKKTNENN